MLAALLLGAALALPAILELGAVVAASEARVARSPIWFWADSRQQLSGLSLALMALLLALAVNVGVGTMVETFSRTFVGWLDGRLAADVYINASDDAQATEIKAWLRAASRSRRRSCRAAGPTSQIDGAPVEILGLPDHATYRDHWPLLQSAENAWIRLRPGDAGFVSEQLARRMKLAIGDRIEVAAPGGNWTLEVVGIYADYGNPKGPDRRQFRRADPALSGHPANAAGPARRSGRGPGADIGAAGQIRAGWPQPARSGHAESRVDSGSSTGPSR